MTFLVDRLEMKFLIPERLTEAISQFVSIYCSMDKYSHRSEDNYYKIRSLYLDTPDFLFLKRRIERCENRFNMRIRAYQDNANAPCYFEVKQKIKNYVRKIRARIDDNNWIESMRNFNERSSARDCQNSNETIFYNLKHIYNAEPKVLTEYHRKAYVSEVDHYARVTFDRKMKCLPSNSYSLISDKALCSYDHCSIFDSGCNIILELKCYSDKVPFWMLDLIRKFDLNASRFSKYVSSMQEIDSWLYSQGLFRKSINYNAER